MKINIYLILTIFVVFFSCKKEKNNDLIPELENPTVTTPTINADKQNVNQLEIVTLTASNLSFNQTTYTGSFDSQTVTLTVIENILGFQIPEIAAGTYTLQANIEGSSYSFVYNIQALPVISNPDTYIQNSVNGIMHTPTQVSNLSAAMSNMYGAQNNATNNSIINNYYTNFQNAFNSATNQEKMDLAKFVAANPILFSPAEDLLINIDSLNGFKLTTNHTIEDRWNELDVEVKSRIKVISVIGVASVYLFTVNPLAGLAGGLVGVKKIYDLNMYLINELDKNLYQFGQTLINDFQKVATPINEFENGTEYTFDISSQYRNLNQQDVNSNSSIIKGIVTSLNTFEKVWTKVMSAVPTSLVGGSFHISHVTASHQKTFKVNAQYLSVANISNSNVTVTTNTTTGSLKVKFNTNQLSNQIFNFDFKYINPNVNTSLSTNTGTILSVPSASLLTNNSSKTWYGDTGGPNDGSYEYLLLNSDGTGNGGHMPNSFTYTWTFQWSYSNGVLHTYNMYYLPNVNNGAYIGDCFTPIIFSSTNLQAGLNGTNCSYYVRGNYVNSAAGM